MNWVDAFYQKKHAQYKVVCGTIVILSKPVFNSYSVCVFKLLKSVWDPYAV